MNETRVNLKHLLEDIRDSYPMPLEEVIIVELVANAIDSGASRVSFFINPNEKSLTILDNGKGMRRQELREYHNIAATTKIRGKGIGFAGIGAKLSLLVAASVITETRGGRGSRCATQWHLASATRAPWKFIPFSGKVPYSRGTAVTLIFNKDSALLSEQFIQKIVRYHFYPLFVPEFVDVIFRYIYKKGIAFEINNQPVMHPEAHLPPSSYPFRIILGKKLKRAAGFGFLVKREPSEIFSEAESFGLAISTYGKVIKYGWEWVGIKPKEDAPIYGIVEIPALAEILTINKMDFLRDAASLKKYYQYRKAIQEAVLPILEKFGESIKTEEQKKYLKPLTQAIERTLKDLAGDFPEIMPLLGLKRSKEKGFLKTEAPLIEIIEEIAKENGETQKITEKESKKTENKEKFQKEKLVSSKGPALLIGLEQALENEPISRMVENKILINVNHPAYQKALKQGFGEYHTVFCVAWTLSYFLEDIHSPQAFINNFFSAWALGSQKTQRLLKV